MLVNLLRGCSCLFMEYQHFSATFKMLLQDPPKTDSHQVKILNFLNFFLEVLKVSTTKLDSTRRDAVQDPNLIPGSVMNVQILCFLNNKKWCFKCILSHHWVMKIWVIIDSSKFESSLSHHYLSHHWVIKIWVIIEQLIEGSSNSQF